jgi:hypothetical protein
MISDSDSSYVAYLIFRSVTGHYQHLSSMGRTTYILMLYPLPVSSSTYKLL